MSTIPRPEALRSQFFTQGNQGSTELFCINTYDMQTGKIRSAWDSDNSKPHMIARKKGDYLYPWQIWLLQAAPGDILTKHKDIITSDYEKYGELTRQRAGLQQAAVEAAGWTEKVMEDAKDEVAVLTTMVREMNEVLPALLGMSGPGFEQRMYSDALKVGKFGR